MSERASLLTMAQLKERGWTPALVKKFLGTPDATRPNAHYRSAAPMQLYASCRVEAIERTSDFQQAQSKASARSQISKTVAARKADELVAQAEQLPVTGKRLPLSTVMRRAIAS